MRSDDVILCSDAGGLLLMQAEFTVTRVSLYYLANISDCSA